MKILDNGIVRDMTAEEEAAFLASVEDVETSPEDKAEAYDILMGEGGESE